MWRLKQRIDSGFMAGFHQPAIDGRCSSDGLPGLCRQTCRQPLAALERVGLGGAPEDAALVCLAIKTCCKAWMAFQPW